MSLLKVGCDDDNSLNGWTNFNQCPKGSLSYLSGTVKCSKKLSEAVD